MNLTRFGVWTSYSKLDVANAAEAARLIQDLGYGAVWLGGSPEADELRPLLAATETLVAATGIVNIWKSDPVAVAAETAALTDDYGDRPLIGIGAGHPEATSDYAHPLRAVRAFLDAMATAPRPPVREQLVLAALGPKMLDLAAERSLGTHPYFTTPEHTRFARERLGAGPLVAVELACVVDPDPDSGRDTAREYASFYLGLRNYTNNLLRFGLDEADVAGEGSDRLIDAVVPHGSAEQIAEVVHAHLDAGADHVCLQPVGIEGVPRNEWTALARALGL